ncbi:MAG: RluA family pseudouridine synthase [Oscillospiraceae bacterium]|jgi:23S rRNA pseudouridine1911/1915/1917 synthase|nr:RluA family pseudouridine synthase [Oscillospiraceae bacterium]
MQEHNIEIPTDWDGERLDSALAGLLGVSRSRAQGIIAQGMVLLRGRVTRKSDILAEGDALHCRFNDATELAARPEAIPLDICFEDDDLLIVNKPQGMVVHPAPGNWEHTLVNALLHHCGGSLSGINGVLRPGIVHRIDKDTSGLLAVAKNDLAHRSLATQIAAHVFLREYRAVAHGSFRETEGVVDAPIARSERDRKRMCVSRAASAKPARTHWNVRAQYERYAFMSLRLETGRTHQIRVHMAHIGHAIAGDPVYGAQPPPKGLAGQCLHAAVLGLRHPRTGVWLQCEADLPAWFAAFLERI